MLSRGRTLTAAVYRAVGGTRWLHATPASSVVCARTRRLQKQDYDRDQGIAPGRVIGTDHPASQILGHSSLRVTRQLEMLNMFLGFEQANRYALLDPSGNPAGFMVEEQTMGSVLGRQVFRLHRPFRILVLDVNGNACLRISRGFSVINSMVSVVSEPTRDLVGESQQEWHLWRRRYNLFSAEQGGGGLDQFARIDAPWLSWDFPMVDEQGAAVAGVFRDFSGIGMELFSDYGLYAVCFDGLALSQRFAATGRQAGGNVLSNMQMDLDRRAVALANAVSIDFDYFSRHSRVGHGGTPWMFFPMSSGLSQEQHDGDMD